MGTVIAGESSREQAEKGALTNGRWAVQSLSPWPPGRTESSHIVGALRCCGTTRWCSGDDFEAEAVTTYTQHYK